MIYLVRVVAPHYVAGYVVENGRVVKAAPILAWAVGKSYSDVGRYLENKGYERQNLG